ncbi:MAG: LTA synthase family protein [Clostridia bacterium]|nr:LTA synthase family protein [Clostridia bacterium]
MFEKIAKKPFLMSLSWALVLDLVIELLSRKNFLTFFTNHLAHHPLSFVFNWLFIAATLSLCQFFRRKYFVMGLLTVFWLVLGGANCYVQSYRTNPLCFIDISNLQISWDFISKYINVITVSAGAVLVVLISILLVKVFRKAPKTDVFPKRGLVLSLILISITTCLILDVGGMGIKKKKLTNMIESVNDYGYVYCFFRGTVERGIDEPDDFNLEEKVLGEIEGIEDKNPEVKPNIIMIQLESFFDLNLLSDVSFSENPTPFYSYLKNNYSWGKLSVPSVGAGTANTEFEIISGMNLDFFGTGEYPYKTILKDETPETSVWNYKDLGYTAFALHNNNATFYDRNTVFATLGFDTFLTKEYFTHYKMSSHGWMRDEYLLPEIKRCLKSTENQDYIYTITVQTHGSYPSDYRPDNKIKALFYQIEDDGLTNQIEFYANVMRDADAFLQSLCEWLDTFEEPTVVVMYGDHMPSLKIDSSELMFGDLFETEYIMYSNFEMEKQRKDLEAYQLSSYVMERLGMNTGVLTKIHQNYSEDPYYLQILEQTQYDMLYGDKIVFDGENRYVPTDIKMGVEEIVLTDVRNTRHGILVKGKNFTPSSYIVINGERNLDTLKVSSRSLRLEEESLEPGDVVSVVQMSDDFIDLSFTDEFVFEPEQVETAE